MDQQTRYWMMTRRRRLGETTPFRSSQILPSLALSSPCDECYSWEEQAFARDSAGLLGGCTWPPRSYFCSFCRREFGSAQALGGHMNIHRRDRARLKQSSSPPTGESGGFNLDDNSCTQIGTANCPSQVTAVVNPKPNSSCSAVSSVSPRVSAESRHMWSEQTSTTFPFSSSSVLHSNLKKSLCLSSTAATPLKEFPELNLHKMDSFEQIGRGNFGLGEVNFLGRADDEYNICSKRRRIDPIDPPFIKQYSSGERQLLQPEVLFKQNPSPVNEELDLELRLGDAPQVK